MVTQSNRCECGNAAGYFVSPDTNRRTKTGLCSHCYEIRAFRYNQVNHSVANRFELVSDRRRRARGSKVHGGTGFGHVYPDAAVVLPSW